jgi:prepilin peptidase CpaA
MFSLPPQTVEVALLVLLLVAAVYDVRYRRIPNWLTMSGLGAALILNGTIGPPQAGVAFALKGFGLAFGVYLLLHLLRAMGAGDVKLMGAVGAMAGWQRWLGIFLVTAIVGGVMAMLFVIARKRVRTTFWNLGFLISEMKSGRPAYLRREELDVHSPKAFGLPHGAVIAIGFLFYLSLASQLTQ